MARPRAEKRIKVQITLTETINGKVADYAKRVGLAKSTFCSVLIGEALDRRERTDVATAAPVRMA